MSTSLGVKRSKSSNGAEAKRQVVGVSVREAARSRSKVDGGTWKYALAVVTLEVGVALE